MPSTYPFNQLNFPVIVELRNPNLSVEIQENGRVLAHCASRPSVVIAHHQPSSPGFEAFMTFWGIRFNHNSKRSLALTQLVMDLAAGRIEQDRECPYLFIDKYRKERLEGGELVYPMLEVTCDAGVRAYNPGDYLITEAYALAADPQIKLFPCIEDVEGNDIIVGMWAGVTDVSGERPVFGRVARELTAKAIAIAAGVLPRVAEIGSHR